MNRPSYDESPDEVGNFRIYPPVGYDSLCRKLIEDAGGTTIPYNGEADDHDAVVLATNINTETLDGIIDELRKI